MNTIFISSTFQDMQQERDLIRDCVLPILKDEIKRYGRNIELCDLRWGVNSSDMEKEDSEIKVLQVCFNEIEKSKPFFIVLLGDRYGWIPDEGIVKRILSEKEINDSEYYGKSVTEMEILYGALKNENPQNVFFYFRKIKEKSRRLFFNNSTLPSSMKSHSKDERMRLELLKKRISKRFPNRVREYEVTWNSDKKEFEGMGAFCNIVCQDLIQAIRNEYKTSKVNTVYDMQFYQYEYAIKEQVYLDQETFLQMFNYGNYKRLSHIMLPKFSNQVCMLVSKNTYGLKQIFSNLCTQWRTQAELVPYCCDQSMSSSSLHNMLAYFINQLSLDLVEKSYNNSTESLIDRFHEVLQERDINGNGTIVLVIWGLHYLDEKDLFKWFPLTQYKNIRFLLSSDNSPASPDMFKRISEEIYFPNFDIIDRYSFIRAYMTSFHKEADANLCNAIVEKSDGMNEQYMEMLMQRLMVLSKQDYQSIRDNGDGIEAISSYLVNITRNAPNTIEELAEQQVRLLKLETSVEFVDTVLSTVIVLPFGISKKLLENFMQFQQISYASIDMTLLCHRLSFIVRETLDGFYRFMPENLNVNYMPVSDKTITKVRTALEIFFQQLDNNSELKDDLECYRNNRLFLAAQNNNYGVLPVYLQHIRHSEEEFILFVPHLLTDETAYSWLGFSVQSLDIQDIEWMVKNLYRLIKDRKFNRNPNLSVPLTDIWKNIAERAKVTAIKERNKSFYEVWFLAAFQVGEMAYFNKEESAVQYLELAKKISKEAFSMFKNRIWKRMHGIPLTEEEKRMGYEAFSDEEQEILSSGMFGFDSEIEDMEFHQLWSQEVRIINNYLANIYRNNCDTGKAELLQEDSKLIAHIADPDPQNKGIREIIPGITIIYPDEIDGQKESKKKSYKPDYRRNSAVQMSKDARRLIESGETKEAYQKLSESSQILKEIFDDGETCEYYNMANVSGDIQKAAQLIRFEAARDISLNSRNMLSCIDISEDNQEMFHIIEEMLYWARIYDNQVNTVQSKGDLEDRYLLSASIYTDLDNPDVYSERILSDIEKFYHYRLEAHKLGEKYDEYIMNQCMKAGAILYWITVVLPENGDRVTKLIREHSNQCVVAEDINSSIQLTMDMEALIEWMWKNSYFWKQPEYSLEDVYIANMENHSMLWEKYKRENELRDYAERVSKNILNIKRPENAITACICIIRYIKNIIRHGEFKIAADMSDHVLQAFEKYGTDTNRILCLQMYTTMIGTYSDAGRFEMALKCSEMAISLYSKIEAKDYKAVEYGKSQNQIELQVESEHVRIYLFQGIALSCSGQKDRSNVSLVKAVSILKRYPEIKDFDENLYNAVESFANDGLPESNQSNKGTETERFHSQRKKIENNFSQCMNGNITESGLRKIEILIEELMNLPEYECSKFNYTIAKYYHVLFQMYAAIEKSDKSLVCLKKAVYEAEQDSEPCELYADIYSDFGALSENVTDMLIYLSKSIMTFESLNGQDLNQDSYAMALYNYGVINYKLKKQSIAFEATSKAIVAWKKILEDNHDLSTRNKVENATRLLKAILLL